MKTDLFTLKSKCTDTLPSAIGAQVPRTACRNARRKMLGKWNRYTLEKGITPLLSNGMQKESSMKRKSYLRSQV